MSTHEPLQVPMYSQDGFGPGHLRRSLNIARELVARRPGSAVLIAHRLAIVRHANLILVLEDGRIVERGRHQELMRHEGKYARLVRLQQLDQVPPPQVMLPNN